MLRSQSKTAMSCSCWKRQFDHFNARGWTATKQLKTGKFYPLPQGWGWPQRSQKVCLKVLGLTVGTWKQDVLCHFAWTEKDWSYKMLTLPKPFYLKSVKIGKAKMIPGPFSQQGWSPDLMLVQVHGGGLPTLLSSPSGLPNRSFLFSSFLSGTSSLFTTASILEPMLFMDCSSCSTRCRRLRETWRAFVSFFLRWIKGFAADVSQRPQIEVNVPRSLIHTYCWHKSLLHCVFICN